MSRYGNSEGETVNIVPVPGIYVSKDEIKPPLKATIENSPQLFDIANYKKYSEESDLLATRTCPPAHPPTFSLDKHAIQINAPLKSSKSPYSEKISQAYRSGTRSCIVPCSPGDWWPICIIDGVPYSPDFEHGTKLIRLKGCGMWTQETKEEFPGITLRKALSLRDDIEVIEVRGVAFPNTSSIELYYNSLIQSSLSKIGMISANKSIGMWIYKDLEGDSSPLIEKSVTLFETINDRRLESHFFAGFDKYIQECITQEQKDRLVPLVKDLYTNLGIKSPSNDNRSYIRTKLIKKTILQEDLNVMTSNLLSAGFPDPVELIKVFDEVGLSSVAYLFARIGFEIGRVLNTIHSLNCLWGSYGDFNNSSYHVNSHCNNLVVIPPELMKKYNQVVAPLDFDMTYERDTAISMWLEPFQPDPSLYTFGARSEFRKMGQFIGGFSSCVPDTVTGVSSRPLLEGNDSVLLWALMDISLWEYIRGYKFPNNTDFPEYKINFDEVNEIVKASLLFSKDEIA